MSIANHNSGKLDQLDGKEKGSVSVGRQKREGPHRDVQERVDIRTKGEEVEGKIRIEQDKEREEEKKKGVKNEKGRKIRKRIESDRNRGEEIREKNRPEEE